MRFRTFAIIVAFLACAGIGRAEIISGDMTWDLWYYENGVLACEYSMTEDVPESEYTLNIEADHNSPNDILEPGYLEGWFIPGHDRTKIITVINGLHNCTDFDWTDYHIDVCMNNDFTISHPNVYIPDDWDTWEITQPVYNSESEKWIGSIDYYAGTPVPYCNFLILSYKITFSGWEGCKHRYWQELTPTPEPGTFVLLACGFIGLFIIRRRFI